MSSKSDEAFMRTNPTWKRLCDIISAGDKPFHQCDWDRCRRENIPDGYWCRCGCMDEYYIKPAKAARQKKEAKATS